MHSDMNMEDNGKQIIEIKKKIQSKSNNNVQLCSEIHTIECVSNVFVPTGKPGKNNQTIHSTQTYTERAR